MTTLRKQIADTLRYIRRNDPDDYVRRHYVEVDVGDRCHTHNLRMDVLLESVNIPLDKLFIRGWSVEDRYGAEDGYVQLYTYRPQTDEEYFEELCQYVCPTEYQQRQYQQYLSLKRIFEG